MKQTSSILLFIIPVFLANCHKHNTGGEHHGNDSAVVFTNAADPRLAQLFTDTSIITFFGSRDQNGRPQSLTGYQVEHGSAHNSDFVAIDNEGRYSSIILNTGEQIHFQYIGDDSLNIIMSGNDTSFQQNISLGGNNAHNPFYKEAKHFPVEPNGEHVVVVTGIDKNINIKVTAKNTVDNTEENVTGDEAVVRVRLMADGGRDYTLTVPYKGGGIYSIPISASGIEFGDDPIRQTIDLIIDKLNTACAKPKSADPAVDKSVPAIIATFVCPLPHPVAKAICLASTVVLIACNAGDIMKKLELIADKSKDILTRIDPNYLPVTDAAVTAWSVHYKYGTQYAEQTTLQQIITKLDPYDIKITHSYTAKDLLTNGDFSSGNTGFYTDYTYCNSGDCLFPLADNGYSVANDASTRHGSFKGKDHTDGTGQFMMVNGARPSYVVWREQVNVSPGANYLFSGWLSSMVSFSFANLIVKINGKQVGSTIMAPAVVNQWTNFSVIWNSVSDNKAIIEIYDILNVANGNDFGLDDLKFIRN